MTTDDRPPRTIRDGLVPLGPENTYNGVKVSSFCMACRDAIARYEHGMQASVELCELDSRKVQAARPYEPDPLNRQELTGRIDDEPAAAHPAPWRWERIDTEFGLEGWDEILVDAQGGRVIGVEPTEKGGAWLANGGPYERALISAAPETEAILRWFVEQIGDIRPAHPNVAKAITLLGRIDAAKGG